MGKKMNKEKINNGPGLETSVQDYIRNRNFWIEKRDTARKVVIEKAKELAKAPVGMIVKARVDLIDMVKKLEEYEKIIEKFYKEPW